MCFFRPSVASLYNESAMLLSSPWQSTTMSSSKTCRGGSERTASHLSFSYSIKMDCDKDNDICKVSSLDVTLPLTQRCLCLIAETRENRSKKIIRTSVKRHVVIVKLSLHSGKSSLTFSALREAERLYCPCDNGNAMRIAFLRRAQVFTIF